MDTEATRPPRVLVGMPTGDHVHHLTALHYAGVFAFSRGVGIDAIPVMAAGSVPPDNRCKLALMALEHEADALMMIDCDMMMPKETLARLWSHGDLDIIGCTYAQRQPVDGYVHGFELSGERISCAEGDDTVREVASLPAGMVLIRRRVLEAIDRPFFRFPYQPGADRNQSEDYDFCTRSRALGFKVWLDPALSRTLGHVGTFVYAIPQLDARA